MRAAHLPQRMSWIARVQTLLLFAPPAAKNAKITINGGTFDIAVKHYNNDNCDWNGELTYNVKDTNTLTISGGKFIEIAPSTQHFDVGATVTSEVVDGVTIYTVS